MGFTPLLVLLVSLSLLLGIAGLLEYALEVLCGGTVCGWLATVAVHGLDFGVGLDVPVACGCCACLDGADESIRTWALRRSTSSL